METLVKSNLQECFGLGKRSPLSHGRFLSDFGSLGDTGATSDLFRQAYKLPDGYDEATADFLHEASRLHQELESLPALSSGVSETEFVSFW